MTLKELVSGIQTYLVDNTATGFPRQAGLVGNVFPALEVVPTQTIIGGAERALALDAQTSYVITIRGVWLYGDNEGRLLHSDPSLAGSLVRAIRQLVETQAVEGASCLEWDGEWNWEAVSLDDTDAETIIVAGETNLLYNIVH